LSLRPAKGDNHGQLGEMAQNRQQGLALNPLLLDGKLY
jgi:hypothetical protein